MKEKRFKKVYSQSGMSIIEIWVDNETGVQYLFRASGSAGGLTALLDADGRPALWRENGEDGENDTVGGRNDV